MSEATTLGALLRAKAEERPEHRIFAFLDDELNPAGEHTYVSLDGRARSIAGELDDLAGEAALLVFPPGLDFIDALYGCLYAGGVAVPCAPPDPGRQFAGPRMQTIVADASPRVVLSPAALHASIAEVLGENCPRLVATDAATGDGRPVATDPADVAVLQYTSGSTGVPRGVAITHVNVLDNCEFIGSTMNLDREGRTLIWLPPYHDMGLIGGLFSPLHTDRPISLMSPLTFLADPLNWLRAIGRHSITESGGPNFAYDLCVSRAASADLADIDLASWEAAYDGAETVRPETLDAFTDTFAPFGFSGSAFYPCYGLAEATLFVTGRPREGDVTIVEADAAALELGRFEPASGQRAVRLTGCGGPRAGATIAIVDPDTRERCPDGVVGEIWISGPNVARGYWGREVETKGVFGASIAGETQRMLRSGDLGLIHAGELFVTGRVAEVLMIDGRELYPTDLESLAEEAAPQLRHNCGAAFMIEVGGRERPALVAEVRDPTADLDSVFVAIRHSLRDSLDIDLAAISLIEPRTIPRTTSGKTRRSECRELFLRGQLAAVGEWLDTG